MKPNVRWMLISVAIASPVIWLSWGDNPAPVAHGVMLAGGVGLTVQTAVAIIWPESWAAKRWW